LHKKYGSGSNIFVCVNIRSGPVKFLLLLDLFEGNVCQPAVLVLAHLGKDCLGFLSGLANIKWLPAHHDRKIAGGKNWGSLVLFNDPRRFRQR